MKRKNLTIILIVILLLVVFYFLFSNISNKRTRSAEPETLQEGGVEMKITSSEFLNNEKIPSKYTCDGENINPQLSIYGVPGDAKSIVLIVDDPDAPGGDWVHWLIWNIPPETKEILENNVPENAVVGKNDFGNNNYGGPCPPSGTHHYHFKVYALDKILELPDSSRKSELLKEIQGHVIDKTELIGVYSRD